MMIRWWIRVACGQAGVSAPTRSVCAIGSSSLWLHGFCPIFCDGVKKLVKGNWLNWRNLRRYHYSFADRDTHKDSRYHAD